jgi:zinc transport system substrate-binding protein
MDALDSQLQQTLEPVKNQVLLVSHPAFGYFCRDYSLLQLSIEFDGKEPCPKHLEQLLNHKRPDIAIALPQHNNKGVRMMAKNLHLPIKVIDPYSYDYFETMHTLTQWVAFHL